MSDLFAEQVRDLGDTFDDGDWTAVLARAGVSSRRSRHWRLFVALAVIGVLAVAVPAMALSGRLDPLFGFSNSGQDVDASTLDLNDASALETEGAAGSVKLLATREGVAFYIARTPEGGLCPMTGPADKPTRSFWEGGCMNPQGSATFPSPDNPVLDFSPGFTPGPKTGLFWISQLRGFAADGIRTIEVIGNDGRVLTSVPVVDNVYVSPRRSLSPGDTRGAIGPAKSLVGLDENGKAVWERVIFGKDPTD